MNIKKNHQGKKFFLIFASVFLIASTLFLSWFFVGQYGTLVKDKMFAIVGLSLLTVRNWSAIGGFSNDLTYDQSSREIRLLQEALSTIEPDIWVMNDGKFTNHFGDLTLDMVKDFQVKNGLPVTGIVGPRTREVINNIFYEEVCPQTEVGFDKMLLTTPVSKEKSLIATFVPGKLKKILPKWSVGLNCLNEEALADMEQLFKAGEEKGFNWKITSAYRPPLFQKNLLDFWESNNPDLVNPIDEVAAPMHSEHQLGTAVDLTSDSIDFGSVNADFAKTPDFKWLQENSYLYGFVLSYPKDKKDITGYVFEPWHFRYVGRPAAKEIYDSGKPPIIYLKKTWNMLGRT